MLLLLLQDVQTVSNCRTAQLQEHRRWSETSDVATLAKKWGDTTYTHESSKLGDQFVLRSTDLTVRRRDRLLVT